MLSHDLFFKYGRAGQIRTDDPLVPNQMRYQLRYSPTYLEYNALR